jgi:hypothetical protein
MDSVRHILLFLISSVTTELKMYLPLKGLRSILFSISVILIIVIIYLPTWVQGAESSLAKNKTTPVLENTTDTESQSDIQAKENHLEPNKIDQVGKKVGDQVDDFTQKASSQFGAWISTKVF